MFLFVADAAAQDKIALAIEGWRPEVRNDVHYYRCASQIAPQAPW